MSLSRGQDQVLATFGSAVRRRRHELGISQEELAQRAGLTRSYITDVERGMRNVALRNIAKLAKALETDIAALFAIEDEQVNTSANAPADQERDQLNA